MSAVPGVAGPSEGDPSPARLQPSWRAPALLHLCAGLLLLVLAGCAAGTRPDPMAGRAGGAATIQLRVTNLGFNDATLTVLTSGSRTRLGVVSGKANQTFNVPWSGLQELRIQISVLAGGNYTTPSVTVNPGERVELLIQENLRSSQLRR